MAEAKTVVGLVDECNPAILCDLSYSIAPKMAVGDHAKARSMLLADRERAITVHGVNEGDMAAPAGSVRSGLKDHHGVRSRHVPCRETGVLRVARP